MLGLKLNHVSKRGPRCYWVTGDRVSVTLFGRLLDSTCAWWSLFVYKESVCWILKAPMRRSSKWFGSNDRPRLPSNYWVCLVTRWADTLYNHETASRIVKISQGAPLSISKWLVSTESPPEYIIVNTGTCITQISRTQCNPLCWMRT